MTDLIRDILTVTFGAIAGGLTNTVAIWMLFHPYEPPTVFGRRIGFLQGAIPKNQERLAASIGRTVGNRLLTDADLAAIFATPEFRGAFRERLGEFLDDILERERGSLSDMLPPEVTERLGLVIEDVSRSALVRFEEWIASSELEEFLLARTDSLVAAVSDESIEGILTPARGVALSEAIDTWIQDLADGEDLQEALHAYLERTFERLLEPEKTLEGILPPGLVGSMERAIQAYLPLAIGKLGQFLEDPEARVRVESVLRDLLRRFLSDLRFHQRVVARLFLTEDTVERVLSAVEAEGADRLSEMLGDPAVQKAMARGIDEAVLEFLRRPVRDLVGAPDDPAVIEARGTVVSWLIRTARDPATRAFIVERMELAIRNAGARTWGDVFERFPPEQFVGLLATAARSDSASGAYGRAAGRLSSMVLERPVGTPARWIPEAAREELDEALEEPMWVWLQTQVPDVVRRLDVQKRVEQKVIEFPTEKMEEMVRRVTDRELRVIVRLGYALGAGIGGALVLLGRLLP